MLSEIIPYINTKIDSLNYFKLYELADLVEKGDITSPKVYDINGRFIDPFKLVGNGIIYHRETSPMVQSQSELAPYKSFKNRVYSLRCVGLFSKNFKKTDSRYVVDEVCQTVIEQILQSRDFARNSTAYKFSDVEITGREIRTKEVSSTELINVKEIRDTYGMFYIDYTFTVDFDESCYTALECS